MQQGSTGVNIHVPAGHVHAKAAGVVQSERRSSWTAHQKLVDGTDTGEVKCVHLICCAVSCSVTLPKLFFFSQLVIGPRYLN